MKTIFITGGAGFIGSALVRRSLRDGMKVVVYDNFSNGYRDFLPEDSRLEIVEGDINRTKDLGQALEASSPDYLCHLAAIHFIPQCNENPTRALQINTVGTESLFNAAAGKGIGKIIIASTAAVYPVYDGKNSESGTAAGPVDIYGLSKHFSEALAEKYVRETGGTTIAIRLFNAVGPRETNPHVIPHIFETSKETAEIPLGNLEPMRDYIHTTDIAAAILALCESAVAGYDVFNVGTGREHSVVQLVELIGGIIGKKLTIRQETGRVRAVERLHLVADISKISDTIGWRPALSLRESLTDTARYYGLA